MEADIGEARRHADGGSGVRWRRTNSRRTRVSVRSCVCRVRTCSRVRPTMISPFDVRAAPLGRACRRRVFRSGCEVAHVDTAIFNNVNSDMFRGYVHRRRRYRARDRQLDTAFGAGACEALLDDRASMWDGFARPASRLPSQGSQVAFTISSPSPNATPWSASRSPAPRWCCRCRRPLRRSRKGPRAIDTAARRSKCAHRSRPARRARRGRRTGRHELLLGTVQGRGGPIHPLFELQRVQPADRRIRCCMDNPAAYTPPCTSSRDGIRQLTVSTRTRTCGGVRRTCCIRGAARSASATRSPASPACRPCPAGLPAPRPRRQTPARQRAAQLQGTHVWFSGLSHEPVALECAGRHDKSDELPAGDQGNVDTVHAAPPVQRGPADMPPLIAPV